MAVAFSRPVERSPHTAQAEEITPLTHCLEQWPLERQAEAGEAVEEMVATKGWDAVQEAISLRITELNRSLSQRMRPFETPAEYEKVLGEVRGLEQIGKLVAGILELGEEATNELRSRD